MWQWLCAVVVQWYSYTNSNQYTRHKVGPITVCQSRASPVFKSSITPECLLSTQGAVCSLKDSHPPSPLLTPWISTLSTNLCTNLPLRHCIFFLLQNLRQTRQKHFSLYVHTSNYIPSPTEKKNRDLILLQSQGPKIIAEMWAWHHVLILPEVISEDQPGFIKVCHSFSMIHRLFY